MRSRLFSRHRDGSIDASLGEAEANVLRNVATELLAELDQPGEDTVRWFPPAYATDPKLQDEFARMTHDDLVTHKRIAAEVVVGSIEGGSVKRGVWRARLTEEQAGAWLGVLNDARLYLGTKIGVTEDMDHVPRDGADPEAQQHNLYLFLSALEGVLISEFLDALPDR